MLYHLYAFSNPGKAYGLSPMGLSGLWFNGHIFWDMDFWMFPVFLVMNPEISLKLLEYRLNRISSAMRNAFINGYKGIMFPWESSITGDE